MEFRILGPLEVLDGDRPVPLSGAKPRALLGILLLHANEVVSNARLVDELWGERPPATAEKLVQGYVHALRKQLGADVLVTQAPGYRLRVEPRSYDLLEFQRLVGEARAAELEDAVELRRRALALWRGPPLADLSFEGPARHESGRLSELRLETQIERIDAELELGRNAALIGELESLVAAHAYQERLHAQLILALYRSGRQAEALQAYQSVRRLLNDELGLQPGQALRELEAAILRQDDALTLDDRPSPTRAAASKATPKTAPTESKRTRMESPTGERRIVAVLIADVVDSTVIGERLGPERSKFFFDEVVRLMAEQIRRYGGTVAQLTGDGVLAVFGAPVAHEDDSERAVRAACGIHEALAGYAREVDEGYGVRLAGRIGVNTGPVVLVPGDISDEARYNALGDTVNVAARLQAVAGIGGVAVGPSTAHQIERRFRLEALGEVVLKGKEAPLSAFLVVGEGVGESGSVPTRFVGRKPDLAALTRLLEDVVDGRGAIASITGEAGIGKSRLVAEARGRVDGVRFLSGHAVSYAGSIPYWPVRELVREWLGLGVSDPEARLRLELRAGLARALAEEGDDLYPFVGSMLGSTLEPEAAERLRQLSRDSIQRQTIDAVYRLVAALAAEGSLCLVLEDLHWADDSTFDLLEELIGLTEESAVLFLFLYRSEREHRCWDLGQHSRRRHPHRFRELELGPLAGEASRELADSAAGGEVPAPLAELLAERAGGNPFFLEEALRDLVERGALRRENGRYELAVGIDALLIPELVQEALQARLERLEPETREVLNVAAVVGRTFGLPLLERVAPRERLLPALAELQRLELSSRSGGDRRRNTASGTDSSRRSHTRACWRRAGASSTEVSGARSRSSTKSRRRRRTAYWPGTSARRTNATRRSSICSRRAMLRELCTRTKRRSRITAEHSASFAWGATLPGHATPCSRWRSRTISPSISSRPVAPTRKHSRSSPVNRGGSSRSSRSKSSPIACGTSYRDTHTSATTSPSRTISSEVCWRSTGMGISCRSSPRASPSPPTVAGTPSDCEPTHAGAMA